MIDWDGNKKLQERIVTEAKVKYWIYVLKVLYCSEKFTDLDLVINWLHLSAIINSCCLFGFRGLWIQNKIVVDY